VNLREAVRIALRGLRANRLRSALTMLGIIIGVASVILLVALGNGVQSSVNEKIQPLANLITVVPSVGNVPGGAPPRDLIDGDVQALQDPALSRDVAAVIPATTGKALLEGDNYRFRANVVGSTDRWLEVNNQDMAAGTFFDDAQVRSTARVVVLGPSVSNYLFGDDPAAAVNKAVRINHQTFRVIGVMQSVGEPGDSSAVMPLNTVRRFVFGGGDKVNQIIVQATQANSVPAAEDSVIRILSERHRIKDTAKRDFEVQSLRSRLDTFNQVLRSLTLFTAAVAAISLVVGAIGVLNIMLVSSRDPGTVPHRVASTGRLGWRFRSPRRGRALGARRQHRARLRPHLRHVRASGDHPLSGALVRDQSGDRTRCRRLPGQPRRPAPTHRSSPLPVTPVTAKSIQEPDDTPVTP
jgi:putative ABC transport system permease protein